MLRVTKFNAWKNHQVEDAADMYVRESYVGKGQNLKRIRYHAQGRHGKVTKPRTHYFLKLQCGEKPKRERDPMQLPYMRPTREQARLHRRPPRIRSSLEQRHSQW